jgi:hypothetical protein
VSLIPTELDAGCSKGTVRRLFGARANNVKTLASVADAAFDSPNKR